MKCVLRYEADPDDTRIKYYFALARLQVVRGVAAIRGHAWDSGFDERHRLSSVEVTIEEPGPARFANTLGQFFDAIDAGLGKSGGIPESGWTEDVGIRDTFAELSRFHCLLDVIEFPDPPCAEGEG